MDEYSSWALNLVMLGGFAWRKEAEMGGVSILGDENRQGSFVPVNQTIRNRHKTLSLTLFSWFSNPLLVMIPYAGARS